MWCFVHFTSKCASCHNCVHFFHIGTSKSGANMWCCAFSLRNVLRATTARTFSTLELPKVVRTPGDWCFEHFDFEMCFAPQRRALFRHLNFQKWCEAEVFCKFWLRNVLRATTACTFWTSQLPKVVRTWCVLYILTRKCASRHNGVQFFISHLASWLRTRRFSEPTFRPSGAPNHWKNTVFRDFSTFSRICIFFLLTLSLLITLLSSNLSLLFASSLLCFSSVHIVGRLTSKLPSTRSVEDGCDKSPCSGFFNGVSSIKSRGVFHQQALFRASFSPDEEPGQGGTCGQRVIA